MDPTPSNPVPLTPSAFAAFQRFAESVRLHWDRAFIRYSGRDQMAIIHSLRDGSDSARGMLGQWAFSVGAESAQLMRTWMKRVQSLHWSLVSTLIVGATLSITSLVFLILHRRPYSRLAEQPPARTQQQIVQLYKKMLELSVLRGISITPSTTPTEICRLVSERWAVAEATVVRLSTLYCRARFGDGPLSHKELLQAVDDLGVLKRLVRTSQ